MNSTIKQRWIEALRSGKYLQDRGVLRSVRTDGFCCLGVLCALYIQDHSDVQWEQDIEGRCYSISGETGALPSTVMNWAGLTEANPDVKVADDEEDEYGSSLAGLNDMGRSFEKIAQVIEEQL